MTQITFYLLSNSLYEEINKNDALHKYDVENKIDEFKTAHGIKWN